MLDGAALGIQVQAEEGYSTYVAVRIIGSVPRRLVATILSLIPGCQLDAWMSDYAMPERAVAPDLGFYRYAGRIRRARGSSGSGVTPRAAGRAASAVLPAPGWGCPPA